MLNIVSRVPHKSVVKEAVCRNCGCTIEYTPNEVTHSVSYDYGGGCDDYKYFKCPNCGRIVEV